MSARADRRPAGDANDADAVRRRQLLLFSIIAAVVLVAVAAWRLADDHRTALDYAAFAQGWHGNGRGWGRPADILEAPDGSILVSDDRAGRIYRIRYVGR